jgi:hypothetical protein
MKPNKKEGKQCMALPKGQDDIMGEKFFTNGVC